MRHKSTVAIFAVTLTCACAVVTLLASTARDLPSSQAPGPVSSPSLALGSSPVPGGPHRVSGPAKTLPSPSGPRFSKDRIIVSLKGPATPASIARVAKAAGVPAAGVSALGAGMVVWRVPEGETVASLAKQLSATGLVSNAEPDAFVHVLDYSPIPYASPNDPAFTDTRTIQAYSDTNVLQATYPNGMSWWLRHVNEPQAWQKGYADPAGGDTTHPLRADGTTFKVGVIDTGAWMNHEDIGSNIVVGEDLYQSVSGGVYTTDYDVTPVDPSLVPTSSYPTTDDKVAETSHGTCTSGEIAAGTNNAIGVAASGYDTKAVMYKVQGIDYDDGGVADILNDRLIAGIDKAADDGCKVISISLGTSSNSSALQTACNYAWGKGCIIVAAAGNDGASTIDYPAACTNVIAVGALDLNASSQPIRASYSNYGSALDVLAPGSMVFGLTMPGYSLVPGNPLYPNGYDWWSGTSMATPLAAGTMAYLWRAAPALTNQQVINVVESHATHMGSYNSSGWDSSYGYGEINAQATYGSLETSYPVLPKPTLNVPSGVSTSTLPFKWSAVPGTSVTYDVSLDGSVIATGLASTSTTFTGVTDGTHVVGVQPKSVYNWWSTSSLATASVLVNSTDHTPPTTTISGVPVGWADHNVTFSLSATDGAGGSGVAYTFYRLNASALTTYTAPVLVSAEGTTGVTYYSVDAVGNVEAAKAATITIDKTAPALVASATTQPNAAGWYRSAVTVHFSATDALSGVASVSPDAVLASEGASQSVHGSATDVAGNTTSATVSNINIDETPPTTSDDAQASYVASATVHLNASDLLSGVASTSWLLDGTPGSGGIVVTQSLGSHTLSYRSTDKAGNVESTHTVSFSVNAPPDTTAPNTAISGVTSGWVNHSETFSLTATDNVGGSGVANSFYRLNGSAPTTYTAPVGISSEGTTAITYYSVDHANNVEVAKTATMTIDLTPPTTSDDHQASYINGATIHLTPSDALSGVASTAWLLDGTPGSGTLVVTQSLGPHALSYWSTDRAGNVESTHTVSFSVVGVPTSLARPSVSAKTVRKKVRVTFAASLSPAGAASSAKLYLSHWETKLVRKRVRGKIRKVKVGYWHLRYTLNMTGSSSGRLSVSGRLPYTGSWRMYVRYAGDSQFAPSNSVTVGFRVK